MKKVVYTFITFNYLGFIHYVEYTDLKLTSMILLVTKKFRGSYTTKYIASMLTCKDSLSLAKYY